MRDRESLHDLGSSERHDELFRLLSIPAQPKEVRDAWARFMEEVGRERAALRRIAAIKPDIFVTADNVARALDAVTIAREALRG